MKHVLALIPFLLVVSLHPLQAKQDDPSPLAPVVFTNVTVIDATGTPVRPDMTVVLTQDRISALGKPGRSLSPQVLTLSRPRITFSSPACGTCTHILPH